MQVRLFQVIVISIGLLGGGYNQAFAQSAGQQLSSQLSQQTEVQETNPGSVAEAGPLESAGLKRETLQWDAQSRGIWNSDQTSAERSSTLLLSATRAEAKGRNNFALETQIHASMYGLNGIFTVQAKSDASGQQSAHAWTNELALSLGSAEWQFSLGRKILAWDVAYAFKPNDVVQQEERRSLISSTPVGRDLIMTEYFDANLAASLVWVNPALHWGVPKDAARASVPEAMQTQAQEQAVAARAYYRMGNKDLYGFARFGAQNGFSAGVAMAWVATEELELHSSVRLIRHQPVLQLNRLSGNDLLTPWQSQLQHNLSQVLIGATWTNLDQHSFIFEAWWDGSAAAANLWQEWTRRNQAESQNMSVNPALNNTTGGNFVLRAQQSGWLAQALSRAYSSNFHRKNLYLRWSKKIGDWEPSADVLWTPEDGGRVLTLALNWQGDKFSLNAGVRKLAGPNSSVFMQLPVNQSVYVLAQYAF